MKGERERAKEQLKPEGNKAVIMEMRKLPRQETRIEGNKNPLREMSGGREILEAEERQG